MRRPSLPKKLFHVSVSKGDGDSLRYAERGGGTFRYLHEARYRIEKHRRAGRTVRVFETDCDWREIEA